MSSYPTQSSASGIWNIGDISLYIQDGAWPAGAIGLLGGGTAPGYGNSINKITLLSKGNAIDFGDLSLSVQQNGYGQMASTTRGFLICGAETPSSNYINNIEFSTFVTSGSATDFGDLNPGTQGVGVLSNSTRGVIAGGFKTLSPFELTNIEYITLSTNGNAQDFGTLGAEKADSVGLASPTRGVFSGGFNSPNTMDNIVEFITIATTGNATDFGDLLATTRTGGAGGNSTRGIYAGGQNGGSPFPNTNVIQYITIATAGNYQDFGDLTVTRTGLAGLSAPPILAFAGGNPGTTNLIDYVTIDTLGNAVDFGDLLEGRAFHSGASNNHGGLQ